MEKREHLHPNADRSRYFWLYRASRIQTHIKQLRQEASDLEETLEYIRDLERENLSLKDRLSIYQRARGE